MILTGDRIWEAVKDGDIYISDFNPVLLEPNSYGFHLGPWLTVYLQSEVDAFGAKRTKSVAIPDSGFLLEPDRFYLGYTVECMGSRRYASELYARLSTSACGIFIQTSAPLGHTGAIIRWTLEIVVCHPVIVYPGMLIGKICFWSNRGSITPYSGRYTGSEGPVPSRLSWESQ
jgi:dCTP deaminase